MGDIETINALIRDRNELYARIDALHDGLWKIAARHPWRYRELMDLLLACRTGYRPMTEVDEAPEWNPEFPPEYQDDSVDVWPGRGKL